MILGHFLAWTKMYILYSCFLACRQPFLNLQNYFTWILLICRFYCFRCHLIKKKMSVLQRDAQVRQYRTLVSLPRDNAAAVANTAKYTVQQPLVQPQNDVPTRHIQQRPDLIGALVAQPNTFLRGNIPSEQLKSTNSMHTLHQNPSVVMDRQFDVQRKRYEYQNLVKQLHESRPNAKSFSRYRDPKESQSASFSMQMMPH